jgi:hypothetical protein
MNGNLVAVDIMLDTDYAHTAGDIAASPSGYTGQMWLPTDLTPVTAEALDTVDISLFHHTNGAGTGTAFATFPCVPMPEQVQPQPLMDNVTATAVAWQWRIIDDTPPTVST